jgi:hypothetical protein
VAAHEAHVEAQKVRGGQVDEEPPEWYAEVLSMRARL